MGEAVTSALEFENVTKTYVRSHLGRDTVTRGVENLSLSIPRGEAFGLLGLNGSGKTTTFKLALGLLRPTMGKIGVLGLDKIGYLPELPYFYSYLTPRETLRFYGRLSGVNSLEERITSTLEVVKLTAHADRRVGEFSKGMVQRVGLAQAILHDPELIILDEPVSGLDPLAIKEFRLLLSSLTERGKTLIISSHSISEVEKVCHRVGVLKEGRLARLMRQDEWRAPGLEKLFVETVS
jgi:ABC-2 type transport system ATP-binding protein